MQEVIVDREDVLELVFRRLSQALASGIYKNIPLPRLDLTSRLMNPGEDLEEAFEMGSNSWVGRGYKSYNTVEMLPGYEAVLLV